MTFNFGLVPQVDIEYRVFLANDAGEHLPADTLPELDLESAIRAADPWRQVELTHDTKSQSAVLHRHVVEMLYDFAFGTYRVELASVEEDVWDPRTKKWRDLRLGASLVYSIVGGDSKLSLAVWTAGAEADGPVAALA